MNRIMKMYYEGRIKELTSKIASAGRLYLVLSSQEKTAENSSINPYLSTLNSQIESLNHQRNDLVNKLQPQNAN